MCVRELINNPEIIIFSNSSTETNLPEDVGSSAVGGVVGAVIGSVVGIWIIGQVAFVVFYYVSKRRKTRNKGELIQGE